MLTAAAATLVGLGALDARTAVTLSVFYAVPPVVVTVLVSPIAGLVLAAWGAAVWATASEPAMRVPDGLLAVDAGLRFVGVGAVVILVALVRYAVRRARDAEDRSRQFLALAAHQLRTPVSGLQAAAEALVTAGVDEGQEVLLAHVANEAARIGRLVGDLLRHARSDEPLPGASNPTDVRAVVREELERAEARNPALRWELVGPMEGLPRAGVGPDVCREIAVVILENASRHAAEGVSVEAARRGSGLVVVVSDDGPGVPPGSEEIIFEPFVSLDGRGGSGLGLALARNLARRSGGDLRYDGSRFVWTLPAPRRGADSSDGASGFLRLIPGTHFMIRGIAANGTRFRKRNGCEGIDERHDDDGGDDRPMRRRRR